jgi:disulfide oxidoreductase YuzD
MTFRVNLNPYYLDSKQEYGRPIICSWGIPTFTGKVHEEQLINTLKKTFNNYSFNTRYNDVYMKNNFDDKIQIFFEETYWNNNTFKITLKHTPLCYKNEKYSLHLLRDVYYPVSYVWKTGEPYLLTDENRRVPYPIERELRLKY